MNDPAARTHDAVGESMRERYGLPRPGVILTGEALFKGWAISTTLWLIGLYAVLAATSQGFWFNLGLMVLMYGYGVSFVIGLPVGCILGLLLRSVRNQWIHVGAFFVVPTMCFWALGYLFHFGWTLESLGLWTTVGLAAAVGRLAVWKDAVIR